LHIDTHRNSIARLGLLAALATAGASSAPVASADTGQPQRGGGCHMLSGPSTTGGNQMMANADGTGAQNMAAMLSKFSCGA
jgi:hypothetical protein